MLTNSAPWLAAIAYGGWAGYSNYSSNAVSVSLIAGLIQAGFAFVATLLLTQVVTYLSNWRQSRLNGWQVFGLCSMSLISVPTLLHLFVGTPSVFLSIFPGVLTGHIYLAYVIFLDTRKFVEQNRRRIMFIKW